MASPTPSPTANRLLLVVIAILLGIIVALLAGILTVAGGSHLPAAIVSGAVAFGGTVSLVLLILKSLERL